MKMQINTTTLQEMVSRAIKGAGNNKLIPITSLMNIELQEDKTLVLTTTDGTNYLYVKSLNAVGDEPFYATVEVDIFSKLISKMTSETVTLSLENSCLEVSGNGKYLIELPLDENGDIIKYPNPIPDDMTNYVEINLTTVMSILNSVKPSLAVSIEDGVCYTGYWVGDKVVGTDTFKISSLNVPVFGDAKLISAEMMNLLSVMTSEKILVRVYEDKLEFSTPDCVVYGPELGGIEDFQIDAISGLVDSEFTSKCKFPKTTLLQLLDRLSLFVGTYDKNGVNLTFTKKGLAVSSKASNGTEIIPYLESKKFKEFACTIDIQMLQALVKTQTGDSVEVWYGQENAIKLVDGNITQILALMEE